MRTINPISTRFAALVAAVVLFLPACAQAASKSISGAPVARVLTSAPVGLASQTRHHLPAFQAGVILYAASNDAGLEASFPTMLDRLAGLKVNTVAFSFPLYQSSWTATDVHADASKTPSPSVLLDFLQQAHSRDLSVVVRPLIDDAQLSQSGHWRGQLRPTSAEAWFNSYRATLMTYATAAEFGGAEVLDIGTELTSLQTDTAGWIDLIASLRKAYHGSLTYSSNWDATYPAFGDSLDFASVDGFYPLAAPNEASVAQLVAAWQRWVEKLVAIKANLGKPVVLTELGTTSEVGSFRAPFTWRHGTGLSLEAQRRYYAASCQALRPLVAGMYWWAYYPWIDPGTTATDQGYTPMGKPAEQEIANCY